MKKIFCVLAFLPSLFQAQDLSWGVSTNSGLTKMNQAFIYNGLDYIQYDLGRGNGLNLSTYLSYRILGPVYVKAELFSQSNRRNVLFDYSATTQYYDPAIGFNYDYDCYVSYLAQIKAKKIGLSAIFGCKLGNFDFYGGLAFNLINKTKLRVEDGLFVRHYALEYYPSDIQNFTDQDIYNQNLSNAQLEADNIMFLYDKSTLVYGLQYHINSLNIGYRRSYGFHQLTLGYDIGRYRYE
jgi:hypothetical protein